MAAPYKEDPHDKKKRYYDIAKKLFNADERNEREDYGPWNSLKRPLIMFAIFGGGFALECTSGLPKLGKYFSYYEEIGLWFPKNAQGQGDSHQSHTRAVSGTGGPKVFSQKSLQYTALVYFCLGMVGIFVDAWGAFRGSGWKPTRSIPEARKLQAAMVLWVLSIMVSIIEFGFVVSSEVATHSVKWLMLSYLLLYKGPQWIGIIYMWNWQWRWADSHSKNAKKGIEQVAKKLEVQDSGV